MLVIKFSHPDDKNEAKFPKAVVIFGLFIAFASVLVMPYDIANTRGAGGGLRVDILWQIIHIILALMIFWVIPFAYFFYENDMSEADARNKKCYGTQAGQAVIYTLGYSIVFILILVIMYALINQTEIPVTSLFIKASLVNPYMVPLDLTLDCSKANANCGTTLNYWKIPVTFIIYLVAFISFIGWFFFTIFVGVGMIALPMDLINDFRTRPKPLRKKEYEEKKKRHWYNGGRNHDPWKRS